MYFSPVKRSDEQGEKYSLFGSKILRDTPVVYSIALFIFSPKGEVLSLKY